MQQQLTALEDKEEARVEAPGPKKNDMGKINSRNARHNFENALHNVSARPGAVAGQGADEVFARRSTRPMNYWATGKKGEQAVILLHSSIATASSKILTQKPSHVWLGTCGHVDMQSFA